MTVVPLYLYCINLLGTVAGMMETFLSFTDDIAAAGSIKMGSVTEALVTMVSGLGMTVLNLIPLNYMEVRDEVYR